MADDRARLLRRRLAELRRQLRCGVDGATLNGLVAEGLAASAELSELRADRDRARRPWRGPGPQYQRVKPQRLGWHGTRPSGF